MYVLPLTVTLTEGGIGIFGFVVLAIFQIGFSVFVPKNFCFLALVFIAVCRFSVFQHLVFSFREKYQHIFGFDIRCGFRSFLFDLFGFRFLFNLSSNYRPLLILNSRQMQMLSRGMCDKPNEISQGSLGGLCVAVHSPSPKVGAEGKAIATCRVQLSMEYCQSFFINATLKLVTKLQATCD